MSKASNCQNSSRVKLRSIFKPAYPRTFTCPLSKPHRYWISTARSTSLPLFPTQHDHLFYILTHSSVDVPVLTDISRIRITSSIPYPCTDTLRRLYEDEDDNDIYSSRTSSNEITSCNDTSTSSPSPSPLAPETYSTADDGKGLSHGAKVGIVVGCVVGALVLLLVVFLMVRDRICRRVLDEGSGASGSRSRTGTGAGTGTGTGRAFKSEDENTPPPYSREPMPTETVVAR